MFIWSTSVVAASFAEVGGAVKRRSVNPLDTFFFLCSIFFFPLFSWRASSYLMPVGALPKWGCKSPPSAHGGMLLPGLYFVFGDMISWYLTPNKGDKLLPTVKGFTVSSLFLLVKPAPSLVGSTLLAPVLLWVDFKEAGTKNKRETDGLVYLHICGTFDNPNDHATSTSCCFTTATSPAASADVHPCSHLGFAAGPCCLASRIQWRCGWVSMKKNPGLFTLLHLPFAKLFGEFSVKALAELHQSQFFAAFYIFWTGFTSHTHTHTLHQMSCGL